MCNWGSDVQKRPAKTYSVTTQPTVEPLSLADFKAALRVTTHDFDPELKRILVAARRKVENDTARKLCTQTVVLRMDCFPTGRDIDIRLAPVSAVSSVTYVDEDETEQTLSSSLYRVDLTSTPPRIVLKENEDWPDTEPDYPNAVNITMTAGYGAASDVPEEARLAVQLAGRMVWEDCDAGMVQKQYDGLISFLRWTEYHSV